MQYVIMCACICTSSSMALINRDDLLRVVVGIHALVERLELD